MTNAEWIRTLDNQVIRYHLSKKCPLRAGVCKPTDSCRECWRNWFGAEHIPLPQMSLAQRAIAVLSGFLGDIDRLSRDTPKKGKIARGKLVEIQSLCKDRMRDLDRLQRGLREETPTALEAQDEEGQEIDE